VAGYVFTWTAPLPVAGLASIGAYGIPQPIDPYTYTANFARASTLGGSATASLIPPYGAGPMTLTVASLDGAYNESSVATYVGVPGTFTFAPKVKNVVSYTCSFNFGQTVTVNASGDGVAQNGR
jgi:hypothetical protein